LNFSLSYPAWFVVLCFLAGAALTFFLYRKKRGEFSSPLLYYTAAACRFLSYSILAFLLLSPMLRYLQHREEKPTLVFLQDNSASQKVAFRKTDSIAYRNNVGKLLDAIRSDYNVKEYSTGNQLSDSLHFNYNESATDLSGSLEMIMSTLENDNLGAIILASDGIYNKGISPLSIPYPFKGSVYTIGLGDTTLQKDALVARVFANKTVYLGDQFVVRSDVSAYGCKGASFTVTVFSVSANKVLSSQTFNAGEERFSKSLEWVLDARSAGLQHLRVSISKAEGELNSDNNARDVFVEVMDSKENILIVADAPHPDVFALKEALTKNKNYKVDVQTAASLKANVGDYNLLILHNLPSAAFNAQGLIEQAKKAGVSLWYIAGIQTALPLLNKSQTCLQINSRGAGQNDVQAILNPEFSYFTVAQASNLKSLPPLSAPFGDFSAGPSTQVLMKQQIGSVPTQLPLWSLQQTAEGKTGVLAGEGLWRWRLYDFNQHKNHNLVDEFILKSAQYLSARQDKRPFHIGMPKAVFTETEPVLFDAELYNENRELVNTPDVTLQVFDENKSKTTFTMNKESNSYSLNAGNLAAGTYSYSASTVWNGKSYTASGNFRVTALNIEEVNTTADFGLLNELATQYRGEFVYPDQLLSLKDKIRENKAIHSILRTTVHTEPLIDWKWLFALLVLLLSAEWFIRKHNGGY